jgi:hypothetical protein
VFTPVFKAWSSSGDPVVTLRRSNILGGSGSSDVGQVLLSTIEVCWLSSYRLDKSLMTFANNADIDLGGCAKMLPRFPRGESRRGESRAYVARDGSEEDEVVYGACCH